MVHLRPASENSSSKSALEFFDFKLLVTLNFCLTLSLVMQEVLVSYELYRVTKDPMTLGFIGLAVALPYISVTLLGGHYADRKNKKYIMGYALCCLFIMSLFFVLMFSTIGNQWLNLSHKIFFIYLFFGVSGLARGFYQPAASALRPYLIPRHLYGNGSTWNSSAWQLGSIMGSIVAGFSYAQFGLVPSLICASIFSITAILSLLLIKNSAKPKESITKLNENIWLSIKEGFRFVRYNKILLYSISLDLVAVLFAGAVAILPVYAQDILQVGAQGLGWMRAAPSIGAFLGLILMTRFSPMNAAWRNMIIAVSGFGLATIVFALSKYFILSLSMLFFIGAFDSISVVIRGTLLQLIPPDHLRGRVLAVNNIFVSSSNEIGAFESGLTAKLFGTIPSVFLGGCVTLLTIILVYFNSKELLDQKIN